MDAYESLRALPLRDVLATLGFTGWKERKGGTEWSGKCPVHQPKANTTSFSFGAAGKFHCFSCAAKGRGAIDLVMAIRQVGFKEAVAWLSETAASQVPSPAAEPAASASTAAAVSAVPSENGIFRATYEKYYKPHPWLNERGLLPGTLERYEVGYYENMSRRSPYNGSVMLKIRRYSDGECVGYLVRNIGEITPEKPKYVFPKGVHKSLELWGAWQLKGQGPIRVLYIVESAFSVMHFHQLGFPAVSLLGWSVSPQQLEILAQLAKGVVYLPDSDKRKEAQAYAGLLSTRLWVKFPEMPVSDPEQLSAEQIRVLA